MCMPIHHHSFWFDAACCMCMIVYCVCFFVQLCLCVHSADKWPVSDTCPCHVTARRLQSQHQDQSEQPSLQQVSLSQILLALTVKYNIKCEYSSQPHSILKLNKFKVHTLQCIRSGELGLLDYIITNCTFLIVLWPYPDPVTNEVIFILPHLTEDW